MSNLEKVILVCTLTLSCFTAFGTAALGITVYVLHSRTQNAIDRTYGEVMVMKEDAEKTKTELTSVEEALAALLARLMGYQTHGDISIK